MRFVYYRSRYVTGHQDLPGMKQFRALFRIYGALAAPIDRTGVLKFPVRTASLFPVPQMRVFTETYGQVCDKRAKSLLDQADRLDVPLVVLWSGGVDSTCALVCLLRHASIAQKERIIVLLSGLSVNEYPLFYMQHIRGKLRGHFADLFPDFLGQKNLVVNGEHNDQIFGSDVIGEIIKALGFDVVGQRYSRKLLSAFLTEKFDGDLEMVGAYVDAFERLKDAAPIPLKTNFDMFWWINFALKWQTVYFRMLALATRDISGWVGDYYRPFYNTEDFQLWSMNNLDKRIRGGWASYKWPAKWIIRDYTKDESYYRTKEKHGSLQYLVANNAPVNFIDEEFKFHNQLKPEDFYEEDNEWANPSGSLKSICAT